MRLTMSSRNSRSCDTSSSVPGETLQPAFEPQHRVEIQVVGGLVEHQHVGARHQRARHVGAHLQSARQLLDRALDVGGREPQAVGQFRGARGRGVAAGEIVVA